jgi:hypothetical protein
LPVDLVICLGHPELMLELGTAAQLLEEAK